MNPGRVILTLSRLSLFAFTFLCNLMTLDFGNERELIKRIRSAADATRSELIGELETLPVRIYQYHHRWLLINDVHPFGPWTDCGFDPSASKFPRDILLLSASMYGHSDICNGGFHQFFSNDTGMYAPEMLEFLNRAGLTNAAHVMEAAMSRIEPRFSRSRIQRASFLQSVGEIRPSELKDPFEDLNDPYYLATGEHGRTALIENAADTWLTNICGIESLHDRL